MTTYQPIPVSVEACMLALLDAEPEIRGLAPGGIEVGAMTPEQQKLGCIEVYEFGMARMELNALVKRQRVQVNCFAETEIGVAKIADMLFAKLARGRRKVVGLRSGGQFLVHWTKVIGGPTPMVPPTQETQEKVMFIEIMVGLQPVA
jgi:hypothetical protein